MNILDSETIATTMPDLVLLKNWSPVSLLCTDFKIIVECLSTRIKDCLYSIIHNNQTHCIAQ